MKWKKYEELFIVFERIFLGFTFYASRLSLIKFKTNTGRKRGMSETPIIYQNSEKKLRPLKLSPNYVTAAGYTVVLRFFLL